MSKRREKAKRKSRKVEPESLPLEAVGSPEKLYVAGVIDVEDIEIMKYEQEQREIAEDLKRPKWKGEDPELEEHPWLGVKTVEEVMDLAEKDAWDETDLEENMHAFTEWEENQPPTEREIEEENWQMKKRWHDFRAVARDVGQALWSVRTVQKVALIGSAALPLQKEVPRFRKFRRNRVAILHECADLDLAIWLDDLSDLRGLRKTINKALVEIGEREKTHVANHQVDVFLLEPDTDRYIGQLCIYNKCPKEKPECYVSGCGDTLFLQQHKDFQFHPDSIVPSKCKMLVERIHIKPKRPVDDTDLPF